jgi:hypothetical protein
MSLRDGLAFCYREGIGGFECENEKKVKMTEPFLGDSGLI